MPEKWRFHVSLFTIITPRFCASLVSCVRVVLLLSDTVPRTVRGCRVSCFRSKRWMGGTRPDADENRVTSSQIAQQVAPRRIRVEYVEASQLNILQYRILQ